MNLNIRNKVAIIGGSSKGLGKGCALQLAKEGVNIVLCANDPISLEATTIEIESLGATVLPLLVDMASKNDNERIVNETKRKYGRIDILINNSGGPKAGSFFNFNDEEWDKAYNDVLKYVIRLNRLVIPYMKQNNWGRIVNITSLTVKEPDGNLILSNVFRSGVVSMAKSLSKELIKDNITINNICPGAFKTDRAIELMQATSIKENKTIEEIENEAVKTMPLGRFQAPEELGDLVAFYCSELAKGITGTTIQIDGGIYNGLM